MSAEPLMTDEAIAELIQDISVDEIRRRCRAGEFSHVKIGRKYRFTEADYDAIVATHRREAQATPSNPWGVRTRGRRRSA